MSQNIMDDNDAIAQLKVDLGNPQTTEGLLEALLAQNAGEMSALIDDPTAKERLVVIVGELTEKDKLVKDTAEKLSFILGRITKIINKDDSVTQSLSKLDAYDAGGNVIDDTGSSNKELSDRMNDHLKMLFSHSLAGIKQYQKNLSPKEILQLEDGVIIYEGGIRREALTNMLRILFSLVWKEDTPLDTALRELGNEMNGEMLITILLAKRDELRQSKEHFQSPLGMIAGYPFGFYEFSTIIPEMAKFKAELDKEIVRRIKDVERIERMIAMRRDIETALGKGEDMNYKKYLPVLAQHEVSMEIDVSAAEMRVQDSQRIYNIISSDPTIFLNKLEEIKNILHPKNA